MKNWIMNKPKFVAVIVSVIITGLFLAVLNGTGYLLAGALSKVGGYSYTGQMLAESIAAVIAVVFAAICGYLGVLKEKGIGFWKSFYVGGFFVGYVGYVVVAQCIVSILNIESKIEPFGAILTFVFTMLLVGFTEELIFRGVIFNLLFDRFSNTKGGIVFAVIFNGLIFGGVHLSNLTTGAKFSSIIIQVITAGFLGALFAIVYARTRNLWFAIVAHAAVDFGALLGGGIFGNGDLIDALGSFSVQNLISVPILLIPLLILCRKSKLEEIVARRNGQEILPTEKDAKSDGIVSLILGIVSIVFCWMGMFFGFGVVGCMAAVASKKAKHENNGLAIAGLITSIIGTVLGLLMVVILFVVMGTMGNMDKTILFQQMGM